MVRILDEQLDKLSQEGLKVTLKAFSAVLSHRRERTAADVDNAEFEALDATYAQMLLDLLPGIVNKAPSLQELAISRIPNPTVRRYFDEAHRCYLFRLNRACVALCRAILEAALKEIFGPNHRTNELLDLAGEPRQDGRPLLDAERLIAMEAIFSAGDSAVHHEHIFDKRYSDSHIEQFLLDMRKILEDLYSLSPREKREIDPALGCRPVRRQHFRLFQHC